MVRAAPAVPTPEVPKEKIPEEWQKSRQISVEKIGHIRLYFHNVVM